MRFLASVCVVSIFLVACGGGGGSSVPSTNSGGGGGNVPQGTTYNLSTATNVTVSSATLAFAAASSGGAVSIANSSSPLGGTGGVASTSRSTPQSATGSLYISITATASLTIAYPTITTTDTTVQGVGVYTPGGGAWNYTIYGVANPAGTFSPVAGAPNISLTAGQTVYFALFSGTPSSGQSNLAFNCPASQSSLNSVARSSSTRDVHKLLPRQHGVVAAPGVIAVEYDRAAYQRSATAFMQSEKSAGTTLSREFDFAHAGKVVHVLKVSPSSQQAVIASLRRQSGVLSVTVAGQRRFLQTVTTPFWSNDPYFSGFTSLQIGMQNSVTGAATYQTLPYAENATIPGQWDMHAIGMEKAYGYVGDPSYGNANAQGSSSVGIAIIDTGVDATQGDLTGGKVAYQKCFITNADGTAQSTGNYATDSFGHGTDVAGIAAADFNNSVGFAGSGGNSSIYAYRVFPTFDEDCNNENTTDPQCGAYDVDIADAIEDAINNTSHHVKVISMSLGGGTCTVPGVDDDTIEGTAVEDAITAGIVVVAAAGNAGTSTVTAPACNAGVIAVGATGLDDGQPNGLGAGGNAGGNSTTPKEYLASYSEYGSTNTLNSTASWGIVAPGGDAASTSDNDDLHWIENIWTSTPFASDDAGNCGVDFPGTGSVADCRILIEGTSQATPHVAGVAAIVCAMNPGDCTPANMFSKMCQYADDISDPHQGCGRLDAYKLIGHEAGDPSP